MGSHDLQPRDLFHRLVVIFGMANGLKFIVYSVFIIVLESYRLWQLHSFLDLHIGNIMLSVLCSKTKCGSLSNY